MTCILWKERQPLRPQTTAYSILPTWIKRDKVLLAAMAGQIFSNDSATIPILLHLTPVSMIYVLQLKDYTVVLFLTLESRHARSLVSLIPASDSSIYD